MNDITQEEKQRSYKKKYWEKFSKTNHRVYGTLAVEEYRALKALAEEEGRSVWEQIWQESEAYRAKKYLPSNQVELRLSKLSVEIRGIGNLLNQMAKHSNAFQKFIYKQQSIKHLKQLEQAVHQAVRDIGKHGDH